MWGRDSSTWAIAFCLPKTGRLSWDLNPDTPVITRVRASPPASHPSGYMSAHFLSLCMAASFSIVPSWFIQMTANGRKCNIVFLCSHSQRGIPFMAISWLLKQSGVSMGVLPQSAESQGSSPLYLQACWVIGYSWKQQGPSTPFSVVVELICIPTHSACQFLHSIASPPLADLCFVTEVIF